MTDLYIHMFARMADYIHTHPYALLLMGVQGRYEVVIKTGTNHATKALTLVQDVKVALKSANLELADAPPEPAPAAQPSRGGLLSPSNDRGDEPTHEELASQVRDL